MRGCLSARGKCHIPIGTEDTTTGASARVTHALGNRIQGAAVVLSCLVRESEKCKENEGTDDKGPSRYLQRGAQDWETLPYDGGELVNARKSEMDVVPRNPWDKTSTDIEIKIVRRKWDCAEELNACERHETEVSASSQIRIAR